MVYSSLLFIYGFLPLSLLIYYVFPKKYRSAVLLAESVVFCGMISLWYLAFMMIYVIINYASCRLTEKQKNSDKHGILPFVGGVAFDTASIFIDLCICFLLWIWEIFSHYFFEYFCEYLADARIIDYQLCDAEEESELVDIEQIWREAEDE